MRVESVDHICDMCFRPVGDNEEMYGFQLQDQQGKARVFKGHEGCIREIVETLKQIYGGNEDE